LISISLSEKTNLSHDLFPSQMYLFWNGEVGGEKMGARMLVSRSAAQWSEPWMEGDVFNRNSPHANPPPCISVEASFTLGIWWELR
jgi:hypothetical protein